MDRMKFWKRTNKAQLLLKYIEVFNSDDGKAILADMCRQFHVFNSTMGADAYETAYNEGARSVVLRILKTINTDPAQLEEMLREGQSAGRER